MIGRRVRAAALVVGLLAALPVVADAKPFAPGGTPVVGGDDPGGATPLAPGVYTDTLARGAADALADGSVRYYSISVRTGQTPYVAATIVPPATAVADGQLGVQVSLAVQGDISSCETDSGSDFASDGRLDPITAVVSPGAIGSENGCPAGNLVVRVERSGDVARTDPLRVEIAYRLEPAVATTSGLPAPAPTAQPTVRPGLAGTPATLASGNGFDTAPLVGSGVYRDRLAANDTRIVRVHLDWGQRFAYSFSSAQQPGVTSDDSIAAAALIRNPLRQVARQASGSQASAFSVGAGDAEMSGATAAPVRYLNRNSDDTDIPAYADAGDYYLIIGAGVPRSGRTTVSYPYSLQIRVFGTPQPGPVYAGASASTAPSSGTGSDGGSDTGRTVAIAAGGVALLVVVALLVALVVPSRRRRGADDTRQVRVHR